MISWLEKNQFSCWYKKYFGIDCPGCGMQRSIIELLKGNFIESLKLYPALIPIIILLFTLVLHLKFKFKYGSKILTWMFILVVAIIVISFTYKTFFLDVCKH
jgi:hypothetical protein